MPTVIVSPCGTSLLTNSTHDALRKQLTQAKNLKECEIDKTQKEIIDKHINERKELIQNAELSKVRGLSAELNGIIT
jgi:hypothetical protein